MPLQSEIDTIRGEIRTDGYSMSIGEWLSLYSGHIAGAQRFAAMSLSAIYGHVHQAAESGQLLTAPRKLDWQEIEQLLDCSYRHLENSVRLNEILWGTRDDARTPEPLLDSINRLFRSGSHRKKRWNSGWTSISPPSRYDELATNFVTLGIRGRLLEAARRDDVGLQNVLVVFLLKELTHRSGINYKDGVDTKANLSFDVFRNIMNMRGLDVGPFLTKEKLIDEKLLGRRNGIAHGRYFPVSLSDYHELHDQVGEMLATFLVDNAASQSKYRAVA